MVKQFQPNLSNQKDIPRCTCTRITQLPFIAFPCHYVYARRSGRGFTEYKVHRQRHCRFEVNAVEVLTANKNRRSGENAETRLKLLTIAVSSATYSPSLWIPFWPHCSPVNVQSIKMKCVYNYCVQRCDFFAPIKSATNRY